MARKKLCLRCKWQPRHVHKLCRACAEYQRRTGKPRPISLIVRHWRRATCEE